MKRAKAKRKSVKKAKRIPYERESWAILRVLAGGQQIAWSKGHSDEEEARRFMRFDLRYQGKGLKLRVARLVTRESKGAGK